MVACYYRLMTARYDSDGSSFNSIELDTKKTLARKLKVTERTIDNRVKDGTIPSIRFGRRVLFDYVDVMAALKGK